MNKIITKFLIFIITMLSIIYIGVYSIQQAITKDLISSLLDETETSELLIHYSDDETKKTFITIHDYIYKSLNVLGLDENIMNNEIINNYIESLSDAILTDVIYNYLNNEKMVIEQDYKEITQISKFLTKEQKEKLENIVKDINAKLIQYLDKASQENKELKLIKTINNWNVQPLLLIITIIIILAFIIAKEKRKVIKSIINVIVGLIIMIILFHLSYKYILSSIIQNMEKYGKTLQMFFNNFTITIGNIWKILVIILTILIIIYFLINYISKQIVKNNK